MNSPSGTTSLLRANVTLPFDISPNEGSAVDTTWQIEQGKIPVECFPDKIWCLALAAGGEYEDGDNFPSYYGLGLVARGIKETFWTLLPRDPL